MIFFLESTNVFVHRAGLGQRFWNHWTWKFDTVSKYVILISKHNLLIFISISSSGSSWQ